MDAMTMVDVASRWLHVGLAIVLLGGSVFMRFVLMPAAEPLPESEHAALRERVLSRWRKLVMIGIGILLLSGFINYFRQMAPHKGDGLYHALMGIKILLALAVFFLASALAGRSAAFESLRQERKKWLLITILLGFAVVALGGFLKVARKGSIAVPLTIRPTVSADVPPTIGSPFSSPNASCSESARCVERT